MKLLFLTLGLLALAVAGIAIKIWAKKDGEFAGTCASQNPMLNQSGEACGFCGKTPDQFDRCTEKPHQYVYLMEYTVFASLFVVVTGIQIAYLCSFLPFIFHRSTTGRSCSLPVSVIVCAKNEAENLLRLIPLLLDQQYKTFELLLINDASTDHTLEVLRDFEKKDQRINIVDVKSNEAFWGSKKYALTLGIKAARYNHLLLTDADCQPGSSLWIAEMSSYFSDRTSIVLGYGKYQSKPYTLVNLFVRYETLITAIQFFSYAKLGSPYMAVGRNIAYTKELFFNVKGFASHLHIRSGDDDLFIQDAANQHNTAICIDPKGFTISQAPENFKQWFRQKRRHISTAPHYAFKHQFLLGLFVFSKLLFWLMLPYLFSVFTEVILYLAAGVYMLMNYVIVGMAAKKLKETRVLLWLPLLEIGLILFQMTIFMANAISKPTHWK